MPMSSRPTPASRRPSRTPATPVRGTRSSRSAGDRRSTPPRRSTCSTTNDGVLMDYVNAPVGKARNPEKPLKPLVAVPTTTGTGAESTTICVLDVLAQKVKTGISHAAAAADPRRRGPVAHPDPAGRCHLGRRDGHPVPRAGELHGAPVLVVRQEAARAAGALLRRQPDLGHVVGEGHVAAGRRLPPGRAPRRRRRRPSPDGARRDVRRARLRQRRRAHPARQCLSHRRSGEGLPPGGLPRRRADGAARHGRLADRARGVPLDLRGVPGATPEGGVAAGPGPHATTARTRCRTCSPT